MGFWNTKYKRINDVKQANSSTLTIVHVFCEKALHKGLLQRRLSACVDGRSGLRSADRDDLIVPRTSGKRYGPRSFRC